MSKGTTLSILVCGALGQRLTRLKNVAGALCRLANLI